MTGNSHGRAALLGLLELVLGPIWVWAIDGERPGDLTLWEAPS